MISIRTVTNELDRMEEVLRTVKEVYGQGVRSSAEYAIEINPASADEFRAHLRGLQRQVGAADNQATRGGEPAKAMRRQIVESFGMDFDAVDDPGPLFQPGLQLGPVRDAEHRLNYPMTAQAC